MKILDHEVEIEKLENEERLISIQGVELVLNKNVDLSDEMAVKSIELFLQGHQNGDDKNFSRFYVYYESGEYVIY